MIKVMFKIRSKRVWNVYLLIIGLSSCTSRARIERMMKSHPEMALVPAGKFLMGSRADDSMIGKDIALDALPQREVYLKSYLIDKYETTVKEYREFVEITGYRQPDIWINPYYPESVDMENKPVMTVSWYDADRYCRWRGKRLPTEAEWEKAARGTDGRLYPWGDEFDSSKCNMEKSSAELASMPAVNGVIPMWIAPVGSFPEGKSPYGVYDMCGNVMEWTSSWYMPYPGSRIKKFPDDRKYRVLRGGSWDLPAKPFALIIYRYNILPFMDFPSLGIRCAKDV